MKAPPTSHTVLLANPEKAHLTVSLAIRKPGLARSAGPNNVHPDSSEVSVIAMKPTAAGGTGSSTSAATTPVNNEKAERPNNQRGAAVGRNHEAAERVWQSNQKARKHYGPRGRGPHACSLTDNCLDKTQYRHQIFRNLSGKLIGSRGQILTSQY